MRRLLFSAVALTLMQGSATAAMNDWFCGDAWVAGEALLLRPTGSYPYVAFVAGPPGGAALFFPKGRQVQVGSSYNWGYKVELGYRVCDNEALVNWMSFNNGHRSSVQGRPNQLVSPVQSHQNTTDFGSWFGGRAAWSQGMCYDVLDGEFAHWMQRDCSRFSTRLFAGLRYARMVSTQEIRFFSSAGLFQLLTRQASDVQGTGPRVGLGGKMELCRGLNLTGSAAGHLLVGAAKSRFREVDITAEFTLEDVSLANDSVATLIPGAELKFGLDYERSLFCGLTGSLGLGYQLTYYWTGSESTVWSGVDSSGSIFSSVGNNIVTRPVGFDGWYFRVGLQY